MLNLSFNRIFVLDFEFISKPGELPIPVCLVSHEIFSGETKRVWLEGKDPFTLNPPYSMGADDLFVAFYSPAEWSCHLALNWPLPVNCIDLFPEFRRLTNGLPGISNSLLGACLKLGIPTIAESEKDQTRDRILQGPPFSESEQEYILKYCESDVMETAELFNRIVLLQDFDLSSALFRGEYMKTIALMEHRGIPIDVETLKLLKENWDQIQEKLIQEIDEEYGVYEGRTFKIAKFEKYLVDNGIPWGRTEKGRLILTDDYFGEMSRIYPQLINLKTLRHILGKLRLSKIPVGEDGRNRCMLSPFRSLTGRNYPSSSNFLFANAKWLRSLMKPNKGKVIAYIDFEQQEFYIAAALSGDTEMKKSYNTGDPYLAFAKLAGAVPEDATKSTHGAARKLFKECILGVQYGMGKESLAVRIKKSPDYANELLRHHKKVYKVYWKWLEHVLNTTLLYRRIDTVFGWQFFIYGRETKTQTILNFPAQATGAEILRVACILLAENDIRIIAPVHDAILVEYDEEDVEGKIKLTQKIMEDASEIVLGIGNRIRAKAEAIVRYPERYYSEDEGIREMWEKIIRIAEGINFKKILD